MLEEDREADIDPLEVSDVTDVSEGNVEADANAVELKEEIDEAEGNADPDALDDTDGDCEANKEPLEDSIADTEAIELDEACGLTDIIGVKVASIEGPAEADTDIDADADTDARGVSDGYGEPDKLTDTEGLGEDTADTV